METEVNLDPTNKEWVLQLRFLLDTIRSHEKAIRECKERVDSICAVLGGNRAFLFLEDMDLDTHTVCEEMKE
jgi:hypothetical protein